MARRADSSYARVVTSSTTRCYHYDRDHRHDRVLRSNNLGSYGLSSTSRHALHVWEVATTAWRKSAGSTPAVTLPMRCTPIVYALFSFV